MAEGRGAYVAAFVVIIIIILLLIFFFCSGCGGGSSVLSCLKACRFCATAKSDQIQLGPCCEAKITNSVGQKTTYTLPDPGADAASFLLSVSADPQTINGNPVVTSSGGSGEVVAAAVTVNGSSGQIKVASGVIAAGAEGTPFTLTNSSLTATSKLLTTVVNTTAAANSALYLTTREPGAGTVVMVLANGGSAATTDHSVYVNFLILPN